MPDIEIPVNAEVRASDGPYGRSVCLIVEPLREKVTHLVVQEDAYPQTQRLVPINLVEVVSSGHVNLKCTAAQLNQMDNFVDTEFIPSDPALGPLLVWPYVEPAIGPILIEHEKVPAGEVAVRRGSRVHATDGLVGRVDELMLDRASGKITHLVLREGHLWGQKDVSIPVSKIRSLDPDGIQLELSKKEIEALPEIPIRRTY